MKERKFITGTVDRLALLYSDGSAGILHEACSIEEAEAERRFVDKGTKDAADTTHIAKIRFSVIEIIVSGLGTSTSQCDKCGAILANEEPA